jgi:hypothetical protein
LATALPRPVVPEVKSSATTAWPSSDSKRGSAATGSTASVSTSGRSATSKGPSLTLPITRLASASRVPG